jgi:hypothetical protein
MYSKGTTAQCHCERSSSGRRRGPLVLEMTVHAGQCGHTLPTQPLRRRPVRLERASRFSRDQGDSTCGRIRQRMTLCGVQAQPFHIDRDAGDERQKAISEGRIVMAHDGQVQDPQPHC